MNDLKGMLMIYLKDHEAVKRLYIFSASKLLVSTRLLVFILSDLHICIVNKVQQA